MVKNRLSREWLAHHRPLIGLLLVQLLTGVLLSPLSNFNGIYLNEALAYSLQDVASVIAVGQIVGMIASVIGGSLSDRRGHKWILFMGVSLLATSTLLYVIRVPQIVIILWFLTNAGIGLSVVSGQGYLTLATSENNLGVSSALYNWGYTFGGAISIPIATLILGEDNFTMLGFSLLGVGVLTAIIATSLPVLHTETAITDDQVPPPTQGYQVIFRKDLIILILLRFLPTCYYGLMTLLPLIIKQVSASNTVVAWYVTGSAIFATFAQLVAGRASDKYGLKITTQLAFITILIAIGGMILTNQSLWGLFIFGSLGIGAAWVHSTLLPGLVTYTAEPLIRGRMFGMLHFVWTIAMAFGTLLGGNLIEIDFRLPFIVVGVLNVIALILTVVFFQIKRRKPLAPSSLAGT